MNTVASTPLINIYVDESCHLPSDRQTVMALGARHVRSP